MKKKPVLEECEDCGHMFDMKKDGYCCDRCTVSLCSNCGNLQVDMGTTLCDRCNEINNIDEHEGEDQWEM